MKFSSVEEDEFSIFLLPMPVSLPGGEVGVSASFRTFPSRLKLSAASIRVARNRNAKGGHLVHFAAGINWPRIYRRARYTSRTCGARSGSPQCAKSNVDAQRRLSFAAVR